MDWRWDWDDWNGRRPLLATVICAFFIVISGKTLLRAFHLLPPLAAFSELTDHLLLRHVLRIVEPVLNLLGAIYLWQMRPFAAVLFAAEAIVSTLAALYLTFIDPSERMQVLKANHHATLFVALAVAFEFALTVYVWRITTKPLAAASAATA
jgi:hypothetical protein